MASVKRGQISGAGAMPTPPRQPFSDNPVAPEPDPAVPEPRFFHCALGKTPPQLALKEYEVAPHRPFVAILDAGLLATEVFRKAEEWVETFHREVRRCRNDSAAAVVPMVVVWASEVTSAARQCLVNAGAVVVDRELPRDRALTTEKGLRRMFHRMAKVLSRLSPAAQQDATAPDWAQPVQPRPEADGSTFSQPPPGVGPDDLNQALWDNSK
jgi:hypothetical protein